MFEFLFGPDDTTVLVYCTLTVNIRACLDCSQKRNIYIGSIYLFGKIRFFIFNPYLLILYSRLSFFVIMTGILE